MTTSHVRYLTLVTALSGATGCQAIGDIFKAGVWVGVLAIAFLAALVFGVTRIFSR